MARPSRTTARRDHTPHPSTQEQSTREAQPPLPSVSVVIPVLNEERMLERCLRALSRQTVPPEEIIVVDNGSTDASVAIAERAPLVRVVHEPRTGITYARRAGYDAARSEVIARIDADTLVHPGWVATVKRRLRETGADGLGGGAGIAELSLRTHFWFTWWYRGFRFWHERSIGVSPILYGFNCAIRREAWLRARPLVECDDARVSDDLDVSIALLRTGHTLLYAPELRAKAHLFRSLSVRKLRRYYATDALTLARHGVGNRHRWHEGASSR